VADTADQETVSLKILVVEDEALVAMLIEDALGLHGHQVVGVADTATAAFAIVERDRPDMALCDVRLADGDSGVSIAETLAASGIICLFLSGNCPSSSAHPQIVGCLPKPFHTASIGAAIQAAHAIARGEPPAQPPPGMLIY
jgi:CheY-like chemotaxis protein